MTSDLVVKGASMHNLKNIDVRIPRGSLCVITGLSGSGKSTLAFDTIYAEGHRRYVESLSAYARQFLGRMSKPPVERIDGLSPAISIDQKAPTKNPRSTVGTITEVYDYLRLLYARAGHPHCPECGREVARQSAQEIAERIRGHSWKGEVSIWAKAVDSMKGEHRDVFAELFDMGYTEGRVDGKEAEFEAPPSLDKYKKHDIEVLVDSWMPGSDPARLLDSVEKALKVAKGFVSASDGAVTLTMSEELACPDCGISFREPEPRNFSFNSPHGACPTCTGLGYTLQMDLDLIVSDPEKSINGGALLGQEPDPTSWTYKAWEVVAKHYGFSMDQPWKTIPERGRNALLFGSDEKIKFSFKFEGASSSWQHESFRETEGLVNRFGRLHHDTKSEVTRAYYESFMSQKLCRACGGKRLRPEFLAVTVGGKGISDLSTLSVGAAIGFVSGIEFTKRESVIAGPIVKEILARLRFMERVGLDYLTLDRPGMTLSGGENQRIRLASQIGSGLVGVLYVLDEPTIGLHQRDNARLVQTLVDLRDLGNTIIVVEHDEETIRTADWLIDLGPGAGVHGGEVVGMGTPDEVMQSPDSLTGKYLKGEMRIETPGSRREGNGKSIVVRGCRENNLKDIDVEIPLGKFVCITGVSGSGKSTFMNMILHKALARALHGTKDKPGEHDGIDGLVHLGKVIMIDQSPIGRTPRSNPATYTTIFTEVRSLFSTTTDAKRFGFGPGRFSFNVKGGRCEKCGGGGTVKIEMQFLPDVYVECDLCHGKRYNDATLQARYKGKNIYEVLEMTIEEGVSFFENVPRIHRKLKTLSDVGLGYMKIGQPATTLSGGEAQRVKLATELMRVATGDTVYLLDEPTTGLHMHDIQKLMSVLQRLVDAGNTVVVIEHQMDVVKSADWVIDLGPEGGDKGGVIVATGTPEQVAATGTHTGSYLGRHLAPQRYAKRTRGRRAKKQGSKD